MSTISSVSSYASTYSSARPPRPDPAQLAQQLFAKLDSSNQGYVTQSQFETAFGQTSSATGTSSTAASSGTSDTASADKLFKVLDSDGDGKLTESELSASMKKLASQLHSQFDSARTHGATQGAGGPPPGPPPGEDQGMTADQLSAAASQLAGSDSTMSTLMSAAAANFDKADTNGDGKVSFKETMAYADAAGLTTNSSSSASSATGSTTASASSTSGTDSNGEMFGQLMKLLSAYGLVGNGASSQSSTLSVSA